MHLRERIEVCEPVSLQAWWLQGSPREVCVSTGAGFDLEMLLKKSALIRL